ncbi:MAG: hypothetical protein LBB65_01615, partial [Burkholderiales bacterium]|nr:hypothetical protein [Burkholderiales bacterium]
MRGNIGWIVLSLLLIVVGWMSTRQVAIVSDAASPDSVSSDAVLSTTTASKYEPPPHLMIERAFFKCETSHSLEGGNFGKGPTKRFGPERPPCTSLEWKRI